MRDYRVVITARAEAQVHSIEEWWKSNRPAAPGLFIEELAAALDQLAFSAFSGSPYALSRPRGVRRVLLRRTRYHTYYTVDEQARVVAVRAVWHASRGKGPHLR